MRREATAPAERSRAARERAVSLRERSQRLRDEATSVTGSLFERLTRTRGATVGERGDVNAFRLRLPRLGPAVAFARNDFARWLRRAGVDERDAFETALACSEVIANAVEHPVDPRRQAFELSAAWDDRRSLRIVVRDYGRWRGEHHHRDRGRGLAMIRRLMDEIEIDEGEGGTRVTMVRRVCRSDG